MTGTTLYVTGTQMATGFQPKLNGSILPGAVKDFLAHSINMPEAIMWETWLGILLTAQMEGREKLTR